MLADYLMNEWSIYVQPINYPTVLKGTERLYVSAAYGQHIDHLVNALKTLGGNALAHAVA